MNSCLNFYKGKKVFITGHNGFKGSWMCQMLHNLGAEVLGYSLPIEKNESHFTLARIDKEVKSIEADIRDLKKLTKSLNEFAPDIVIHMAAQPIVRDSYTNPVYTYETNVMGTVNILEAIRTSDTVRSFVNVTTDKVYLNKEWNWGYRENEELNGYDPYSNSKSCSELVTSSYKNSFFKDKNIAITTCRAGNVIGGGDFANDRIIPDCIRAIQTNKKIIVRNPHSIRPYQHVLEPIYAYLMIAQAQYIDKKFQGAYNVGPDDRDCVTTGQIVSLFCNKWNEVNDSHISWENKSDGGPHEANFLKLDCSKLKSTFDWKPRWSINEAIDKIVEWNKCYLKNDNIKLCTIKQIEDFLSEL